MCKSFVRVATSLRNSPSNSDSSATKHPLVPCIYLPAVSDLPPLPPPPPARSVGASIASPGAGGVSTRAAPQLGHSASAESRRRQLAGRPAGALSASVDHTAAGQDRAARAGQWGRGRGAWTTLLLDRIEPHVPVSVGGGGAWTTLLLDRIEPHVPVSGGGGGAPGPHCCWTG